MVVPESNPPTGQALVVADSPNKNTSNQGLAVAIAIAAGLAIDADEEIESLAFNQALLAHEMPQVNLGYELVWGNQFIKPGPLCPMVFPIVPL
jgi:hypothetical protein